jgi:quinolinate synthase
VVPRGCGGAVKKTINKKEIRILQLKQELEVSALSMTTTKSSFASVADSITKGIMQNVDGKHVESFILAADIMVLQEVKNTMKDLATRHGERACKELAPILIQVLRSIESEKETLIKLSEHLQNCFLLAFTCEFHNGTKLDLNAFTQLIDNRLLFLQGLEAGKQTAGKQSDGKQKDGDVEM